MPQQIIGPTSQHYFSHRLKLHYVDWGNAGAPPLLMIHGGYDHARNWDWMAQELRRDYHIIAPDLRGHGDSEWGLGGSYMLADFVYDIAQILRHTGLKPVRIIGHSFGGFLSLLFAGTFPEMVHRLIAIDPFIHSPQQLQAQRDKPVAPQLIEWMDRLHQLSARQPRRYPTLGDALQRMRDENPHLSIDQARHLTIHGVNQNEDGSYSWKYDNYMRSMQPQLLTGPECMELWSRIACPVLFLRGGESKFSDPQSNGALAHFQDARAVNISGAGHWVHHDKLEQVLEQTRGFLTD